MKPKVLIKKFTTPWGTITTPVALATFSLDLTSDVGSISPKSGKVRSSGSNM
eukprot:CAMPEP_0204437466 /NCGR_PEP_ID=MMETSP0470-20130426/77441_1 /ASSEMBLY_ACC=CAM_ASM_000385 /TAXON_ID=2969 /ORGANISM="Oxyrrhis marina" /LENGTH=51 /DNA_ID=CAMNT_0051436197 /DNA_START=23 /DNA_END=178 /DNA_ORIENTATION=+